MNKLLVNLGKRTYPILIGCGIVSFLGKILLNLKVGCDVIIITNPLIKNKFGKIIKDNLKEYGFSVKFVTVADSERSKSKNTVFKVIEDIANYDRFKKIFILSLGGGVTGDISGFVAAIYKRGIPYIQVPTTLLAQIDSSIGGKTGIDLKETKNLVGSFYQPRLVFSDIHFLLSLKKEQIKEGLCEAIKYGIIKSKNLFEFIEKNILKIFSLDPYILENLVFCCSQIKAKIVSSDETEEKQIRTILNFGHTIGHAFEAGSSYRLSHGKAIALGMLCESEIARLLGILKKEDLERINNLIFKAGLPIKFKNLNLEKILEAYYHDKKFINRVNRFVLPLKIGKVKIYENIPLSLIKKL